VTLNELINKSLYEEDNEPNTDDQELASKDLSDVDREDLEDTEVEEEDVAVSVKLNKNVDKSGQIELVDYTTLSTLNSIESILDLFDIKTEDIHKLFEKQLVLTIQSPIRDFKDEKYIIRLMDGMGQITIEREDLHKTIEKKGTGQSTTMDQAVQQQVSGEEGTQEPQEQIDISYLDTLNYEYKRFIKDEFFERILNQKTQ
jgi:hypothetical protein